MKRAEQFKGMSKREAIERAEAIGYMVDWYHESTKGIPKNMLLKCAGKAYIYLSFDKHTRRVDFSR